MAELPTRNVFLDTEAFKAENYFLSKAMKQLLSLAKQGSISIKLTNITKDEIQKKLLEDVQDIVKKTRWYTLKNFGHPGCSVLSVLGMRSKDLRCEVRKVVEANLVQGAGVEVFRVSVASVDEVFRKYFEGLPPFSPKGENKCEFPDAFALEALREWCKSNNERMYVVGKDGGVAKACKQDDLLIAVSSVAEFLDLLSQAEYPGDHDRILKLLEDHDEWVKEEIRHEFEWLLPYLVDREDGQFISNKVENIKTQDWTLIELGRETATVRLQADIRFSGAVRYLGPVSRAEPFGAWQVHYSDAEMNVRVPVELAIRQSAKDPLEFQIENVVINDNRSIGVSLEA